MLYYGQNKRYYGIVWTSLEKRCVNSLGLDERWPGSGGGEWINKGGKGQFARELCPTIFQTQVPRGWSCYPNGLIPSQSWGSQRLGNPPQFNLDCEVSRRWALQCTRMCHGARSSAHLPEFSGSSLITDSSQVGSQIPNNTWPISNPFHFC